MLGLQTVAAALLLLGADTGSGQPVNSTVITGAPPAWVEMIEPAASTRTRPAAESVGSVLELIDTEINRATAETSVHVVKRITTETGVQNEANLKFSWDPSYQELIVHRIVIRRGGQRLDQLDPSRFRIIQQETDLDRQIYNGTLSAVLFLEDVRPGDRVEYAYTLRGQHPSLVERFSDTLLLGMPAPIEHRRIRLLWPEGQQLNYAVYGIKAEPEVRNRNGLREYTWDLHDQPAVMVEDQIPSWFMPYPWLQVSEFTNWQAVADWATKLFATTNLAAPELRQEITRLKQRKLSTEQTVQQALELVQKDVRYLGIEFGPNSYRPTDPAAVLKRRFGDCKDKALLLCTLLRALGYEASPVLVATEFRRTLPDLLPASHDFDHAIVRVVAGDRTYWLDPTRSYQHAPIGERYQPAYAFGLLVDATTTNLIPVPTPNADTTYTVTKELFKVGAQKGFTKLNVTTTFHGFNAEWMRAVLEAQGRERLAASYLNDYAQRYPGTTTAMPMMVEDAQSSDTVTIFQNYIITNFWVLSADNLRYKCEFYPLGIHSWIGKPLTTVRQMPMELSFPQDRRVETTIELPTKFKLSNFEDTIEGPAARLHIERTFEGQTVVLKYEYRSLTNFVPVSLVAKHVASLGRMESGLGYSLKWQNMGDGGKASQFNWPIFLLATVYALAFSGVAGFLSYSQCRKISSQTVEAPPLLDQSLNGLGGWLVLVAIGLFVNPIHLLAAIVSSLKTFSLFKWQSLTSPGGVAYNPLWAPLLIFELLTQISMIIFILVLLVLFFQKRRIFPRWFIGLQILNVVFIVGETVGMHFLSVSSSTSDAIRAQNLGALVAGWGIWVPYMLVSRRVKATFVR